MEEKKFCMKSRAELDEIRKQQASKKASVNENEELKVGDIARYNGHVWVKIKSISPDGLNAIVNPIHPEDIKKGRFGEEERVGTDSLEKTPKLRESKINEISDELANKVQRERFKREAEGARKERKAFLDGNVPEDEYNNIKKSYIKNKNKLFNNAMLMNRRNARKAQQESLLNEKSTKIPSDLIGLVTQISMDYGIKFDPATKRYAVEDDETGDILVTGTANTIRKWAVENGAKKPMKDPGFKIDGAETLDQVYRRNWNKAMQGMNRNESLTASKALAMSKAILEGEELLYYPVGKMEIGLPLEAAKELSMGGDAQPAVDYWKKQPEVKNQLDKLTDEQIDSIKEYLDMDDAEFANLSKEDKLDYIIWIVGGYIYDEWYENKNESYKSESKINEISDETVNRVYNKRMKNLAKAQSNFNPETGEGFGYLVDAEQKVDRNLTLNLARDKRKREELQRKRKQAQSESKINENSSKVEDIKTAIQDALNNIYADDKEILEYIYVDVTEEGGRIVAEVRTELDYNDTLNLSLKLDKVIRKFDRMAYFDMETPNSIEAVIELDKSESKINEEFPKSLRKDGYIDPENELIKGHIYSINDSAIAVFSGSWENNETPIFYYSDGTTVGEQGYTIHNVFKDVTDDYLKSMEERPEVSNLKKLKMAYDYANSKNESKINESKDYQFDNIVISIYGESTEDSKVVEEKMSGFGMQNIEIVNVYNSEDEAVQDHLARIKAGEQPNPLVYETQEVIDFINKHHHLPSLDADVYDAEYSAWAD